MAGRRRDAPGALARGGAPGLPGPAAVTAPPTAPPSTTPAASAAAPRGPQGPEASPGALERAFAAGVEGSLARVYREHAPLVMAMAARAVGPAEAEDVVQSVFVAAWRGRGTYDPARGSLAGWLVGITRHRVADALGARRRRGELLVDTASDPLVLARADDGAGHDQATADRVTVLGALDDLGEPRRTVVELAFFEEMTHREISESTGMPLGTVKSHLRRAMLHLRDLLEPPVTTTARLAPAPGERPGDRRERA